MSNDAPSRSWVRQSCPSCARHRINPPFIVRLRESLVVATSFKNSSCSGVRAYRKCLCILRSVSEIHGFIFC